MSMKRQQTLERDYLATHRHSKKTSMYLLMRQKWQTEIRVMRPYLPLYRPGIADKPQTVRLPVERAGV